MLQFYTIIELLQNSKQNKKDFSKVIDFFFQMESHCDTDCPIAPIACTFSLFGCKERVSTWNGSCPLS